MKRLLVILALSGATCLAFGQSKTVQKFHEKYENDRDAKVISLNGGLFKLLSTIASFEEEDEDVKVIARIADNIQSMDVLSIPMYKSGFDNESIDEMRNDLKKEKYEMLMEMKEGSDRIYFLTQGRESIVKNMLVLIREDEEFMVMNVNGSLDLKDLAYLAKNRKKWN